MTPKEERKVKEVNEKYTLAQNKKDEDSLHSNFDKWENYYAGKSEELEKRAERGLSALMPAWAQAGVDYVLAKEVAVIFGQKPYWSVGATRKKWEGAAKLQQELLTWHLDNSKEYLNCIQWLQTKGIYGTSIRKPMWDRQLNEFALEEIDNKNFYPSPDGTSIFKIPWAIQRSLRTREYIKAMGKPWKGSRKSTYINTKELLSKDGGQFIMEHAEEQGTRWTDEEKKNLYEVLECWNRITDRVITIGERRVLLRDSDRPYEKMTKHRLPFIVMIDWPRPKSFWGIGRIEAIELHLRELAHIKNQRFDNVNLILNPPLKYVKDAGVDLEALPIKPNALIGMDDLENLKPFFDRGWPFVTQNVYAETSEIEKEIQNRLGLQEPSMGRRPEQRETATALVRLQQAGNTIFQFMNMMSLWLGMKELAAWTSAIDQQYLKDTISIPYLYDSEHKGEYLTITKARLQGEFYFTPKVAPLDPESIKDVQRGQFITAVQTILAMQAKMRLGELGRLLLEKFDVAQEDIDKILPKEEEIPGLPPGGAEGRGGRPPTKLGEEISAQTGKAMPGTPPGPEGR